MLRFYIPNMTCGGCASSVTKALLSVDPQAVIEPIWPRVKLWSTAPWTKPHSLPR